MTKMFKAYYQIMTRINGAAEFARCATVKSSHEMKIDVILTYGLSGKQIFAQDFGIPPYLLIRRVYRNAEDDMVYMIKSMDLKAYLTLPTVQTSDESRPDPERVSLAIKSFTNPSPFMETMKSLTEEQRRRFTRAASILDFLFDGGILDECTKKAPDSARGTSHSGPEVPDLSTGRRLAETKPEDTEYDPTVRICSYARKDSSILPQSSIPDAKLEHSGNSGQEDFLIVTIVFCEESS